MPNSTEKLPKTTTFGGDMKTKNYSNLPAKKPRVWRRQTSHLTYNYSPPTRILPTDI